ncbi:MAG TPA: hypothetical protein VMV81_07845 [Phycisphaerae bacterium]|nr:hypothetical protein [Phycisphaerae bacterium]
MNGLYTIDETAKLYTIDETAKLIVSGKNLLLAGDETLLQELPPGRWIGGTSPYFIGAHGGVMTSSRIFVTVLPEEVVDISTHLYDESELPELASNGPENGFTFLIIPAFTSIHRSFAENVHNYPRIFERPLLGWVAGVALEDIRTIRPKVFDGRTGKSSAVRAAAVHARLKDHVAAEVGIVNLFCQGSGPEITVERPAFSCRDVYINGDRTNFAAYILNNKIDARLPLVADYYGAMVNVSVREIDLLTCEVNFYAPLFPDVTYRFASPIDDYEAAFSREIQKVRGTPAVSVNCILNYVYGRLEGKRTGGLVGPITFGEIAYRLLNQTLVYMILRRA